MASIRKRNARKYVEHGAITSMGVYNNNIIQPHGLIFHFHVGLHRVELTHTERDELIAAWQRMEKDWEKG